jgi:hypothetical protein
MIDGCRSSPLPSPVATVTFEAPWDTGAWSAAFLTALAGESEHWMQLLLEPAQAWFRARSAVAGRGWLWTC